MTDVQDQLNATTLPPPCLADLCVIVTGGASGIGRAVCASLIDSGAAVGSIDRPDTDSPPAGTLSATADLTDGEAVKRAVENLIQRLGRLDGVVHSAGIGAVGAVDANDDAEWQDVYDVNVLGVVRVMRSALPELRKSQHPSVVTVCSVASESGLSERAVYSASKGALLALTLSMAADFLADGVRVNAVAPATTDTPWVTRLLEAAADHEQARAALVARQPLHRLIRPEEVAHAVKYLLDPASASTTGTVLHVDGGFSRLRPAQASTARANGVAS